MANITFFTDGSHVHQSGSPKEKFCRQDCDESRRVKDALDAFKPGTSFFEIFKSGGNFDRTFRNFGKPTKQEPAALTNGVTIHLHRENQEEKLSFYQSALTIGVIAAIAFGAGCLGYQNAEAVQRAGDAIWQTMRNAWNRASFSSYGGYKGN